VELTGGVGIDGCRFTVRSAAISTSRKSLLASGGYELAERQALRFLDPDLPLVELGGAIGVVACLANRRLRDPQRHLVLEANPRLVPLLAENRRRNGGSFRIVARALAYDQREIAFGLDEDFLAGRVGAGADETVQVPTTTLAALLDGAGFDRCSLICDIEGMEVELVRRELDVIAHRVALLVLETHPRLAGGAGTAAMLASLERAGFEAVWRREDTIVYRGRA
jgi:FkbM family methyltransferase